MEKIQIDKIIGELDSFFAINDMEGAGLHLEKWEKIAREANDLHAEITIQSEMMGYYRKVQNRVRGLHSVERGIYLVRECGLDNTVSGATVILNGATTMKAFGQAEEALPFYREAREVYERELDRKDCRLAGLYNNMALAMVDLKKFGEAERLYLSALEVLSGNTEGLLDSGVTYCNMAHMYEDMGDMNNAEKSMGEALLAICDTEIADSPYKAYVFSKCAPSFTHFGDSDSAAYLMSVSEEIYDKYRRQQ